MNDESFLIDYRPFASTFICGWSEANACIPNNTWGYGEYGDLYDFWYSQIIKSNSGGYKRIVIPSLMGTPDGNPVCNLLGAWDRDATYMNQNFPSSFDGGSQDVIDALYSVKSEKNLEIWVTLKWSLPLDDDDITKIDFTKWDGDAFPDITSNLCQRWLSGNLSRLKNIVDGIFIYGAFNSERSISMAESRAIAEYIMTNFGMRIGWMEPQISFDVSDGPPRWILRSAPVLLRANTSSDWSRWLSTGVYDKEYGEIHIISNSYNNSSKFGGAIVGSLSDSLAIHTVPKFGKQFIPNSRGTILSSLAGDVRTINGLIPRDNGYLGSSARDNSRIHPCVVIDCKKGALLDDNKSRSQIPSWWISGNKNNTIDKSSQFLVSNRWDIGPSQLDLAVESPYDTIGAEKAADLAFDMALSMSAISSGCQSAMYDNGISIQFNGFGTPLPSRYCDDIDQDDLSIYPFCFNHPDDSIVSFYDSSSGALVHSSHPYATPFVEHGAAQSTVWMHKFIKRFKYRANLRLALHGPSPFVPWISLMIFNPDYFARSEFAVMDPYPADSSSCESDAVYGGYWDGVASDDRFSLPLIPGVQNKSLQSYFKNYMISTDLLSKSGSVESESYSTDVDYQKSAKNYADNRAFSMWFDTCSKQIVADSISHIMRTSILEYMPSCNFIIPNVSVQRNQMIPDLSSAYVADIQGIFESSSIQGGLCASFPYMDISQFSSSILGDLVSLPYGAYFASETAGDPSLRDGSNRTDWILAQFERSVLKGKPIEKITSAQLNESRKAMSKLHCAYVSRWIESVSGTKDCFTLMPLPGLLPKGGIGDIRTGISSNLQFDIPTSYEDTKYFILAEHFSSIINSSKNLVIIDTDRSRSRLEWNLLESILKGSYSAPIPTQSFSVEVPDSTYDINIGFTGSKLYSAGKKIVVNLNKESRNIKIINSSDAVIFTQDINSKNISELIRDLARYGVAVKVPPALTALGISEIDDVSLTISVGSSSKVQVRKPRVDKSDRPNVVYLHTTSPDPVLPSKYSIGGYFSNTVVSEIGKLSSSLGYKANRCIVDRQNLPLNWYLVGSEPMMLQVTNGVAEVKTRTSRGIHVKDTLIKSIPNNFLDQSSRDGDFIIRCVGVSNFSSSNTSASISVKLSGLPSSAQVFIENPIRQGFIFTGSSASGSSVVDINRAYALSPGMVISPLINGQFSSRHVVQSAYGSEIILQNRIPDANIFWCLPNPVKFVQKPSDLEIKKLPKYNYASGEFNILLSNMRDGDGKYVWVCCPAADLSGEPFVMKADLT